MHISLSNNLSFIGLVMHENFFSNLDGLGGYNENLISHGDKFCIAKFLLVGVCKSTDEMIPYELFDGMIGRRPLV